MLTVDVFAVWKVNVSTPISLHHQYYDSLAHLDKYRSLFHFLILSFDLFIIYYSACSTLNAL
jgi:hypothetical protein